MKKKTYKMGLVGCMSVLVMLTGLWVYDQNKIPVSEEPVVSIKNDEPKQEETKEKINYPYLDENVKVVRTYYDQNDDTTTQQASLVLFEGVYRPNQGTDFANENTKFDVVACLSGEVTQKKDDPIFGLMVTIKSNDIEVTYQSLDSTTLEVNQKVKQGDVIGTSGENLYEADLGNHLHLIIENEGVILNPEKCFSKTVDELS